MTSGKVYILQKPFKNKDFSSAARYGAIHYIFESTDSPSLATPKAIFKIRQKLKDFDPEKDYIVSSGGDPIVPLLVGSVLQTLGIREYSFLRWERERDLNNHLTKAGFYVPVLINLKQF